MSRVSWKMFLLFKGLTTFVWPDIPTSMVYFSSCDSGVKSVSVCRCCMLLPMKRTWRSVAGILWAFAEVWVAWKLAKQPVDKYGRVSCCHCRGYAPSQGQHCTSDDRGSVVMRAAPRLLYQGNYVVNRQRPQQASRYHRLFRQTSQLKCPTRVETV